MKNLLFILNMDVLNAEAAYGINLAYYLQKIYKKNVYILTYPNSKPYNYSKKRKLKVVKDIYLDQNNILSSYSNLLKLAKFMKRRNIDTIFNFRGDGFLFSSVAKKLVNRKIKNIRVYGNIISPFKNVFNNWLFKSCDYIITSAKFMENYYFEGFDVSKSKINTIYIPIVDYEANVKENKLKKRLTKEGFLNDDTFLISMIARLDPVKDHETAIKALSLVQSKKVKLLISGEECNTKVKDLEKLVSDLDLVDRVKIIDRDDIHELLDATDLGMICSLGSEANCRILLEYNANKVPVIGTNVSVIPELIEKGVTGYVYEKRDYKKVAKFINRLISNKKEYNEMKENAYNHFHKNFKPEKIVNRIYNIVNGL